jgi:hypothetical protein
VNPKRPITGNSSNSPQKEHVTSAMKLIANISVWGKHEEKTLNQIQICAATADRAALMADGHLGYAVPIGGVVAYKDALALYLLHLVI